MAVVVTERDETAKFGNIDESLEHEREAQVETRQLLADLKDKEAIALEMIAILRGVTRPSRPVRPESSLESARQG